MNGRRFFSSSVYDRLYGKKKPVKHELIETRIQILTFRSFLWEHERPRMNLWQN
jgi:hypothetical protein